MAVPTNLIPTTCDIFRPRAKSDISRHGTLE